MQERIHELIIGHLNGELTTKEELELKELLDDNDSYRAIYQQYHLLHSNTRELNDDYKPDVEAMLKRIKGERKQRPFPFSLLRYAAVALLLSGLSWSLYQWRAGDTNPGRNFEQIATPGREKALLKRENEHYTLDKGMEQPLMLSQEGIEITIDEDNVLTYSVTDTLVSREEVRRDELIVPRGGEFQLMLADGTKVWLNSSSSLSYPRRFTGNERRVQLSGEAYFEVAENAQMPFIVETLPMNIKVLGTHFNVNTYGDQGAYHTTLVQGSVEVAVPGAEAMRLNPGEQLWLKNDHPEKRTVNLKLFTAWRDGKFIFDDAPLEEIIEQVSRWYDVDIFFASEELKQIRFSGAIVKFNSLEDFILMIEKSGPVLFSVEDKTVMISGK